MEMLTAVKHIDEYLNLLIIGRHETAEQYVPVITRMLNEIIPHIIKCHGDGEISNQPDPIVWVQLLKNSIDAMEADDDFIIIDAYKDMAEMLKYYLDCMETANE